jgi:hypothetical protein
MLPGDTELPRDVGPLFERGFIGNTFANRVGKGTHRAIGAYEGYPAGTVPSMMAVPIVFT